MRRIALTDGSGNWFDYEKAEAFAEGRFHDGRNWISKATGSQWEHEELCRTAGGKWVLNRWSQYQGTRETYELISADEAAKWFARNELEPPERLDAATKALEI